jgi:DNA-binding IscR family transcriptional regulator
MSTITSTTTPRLSATQSTILDHLRGQGSTGFTFSEAESRFTHLSPSRVRTIVSELVKLGLVRSSGHTAPGSTGRGRQTIWIAA